jgi:predicted small metal-binding protein
MERELTCDCGARVAGATEDELVRAMQRHASDEHGVDLPRELALLAARAAGPTKGSGK